MYAVVLLTSMAAPGQYCVPVRPYAGAYTNGGYARAYAGGGYANGNGGGCYGGTSRVVGPPPAPRVAARALNLDLQGPGSRLQLRYDTGDDNGYDRGGPSIYESREPRYPERFAPVPRGRVVECDEGEVEYLGPSRDAPPRMDNGEEVAYRRRPAPRSYSVEDRRATFASCYRAGLYPSYFRRP